MSDMTVCPICGESKPDVERRHRNTMYNDDESNYLTSCMDCFQEDWDYYQELWDDIYADQMASVSQALHDYYSR